MCFSAEASFAAAGALLPAGAYCVYRAARTAPRALLVALVPAAFGVQQAVEGVVLLRLQQGDPGPIAHASAVFLFFAVAFWPIWLPLSLGVADHRIPVRLLLSFWAALSLVWVWVIFPVLVEPPRWVHTEVVHHSIQYTVAELPAFVLLQRMVWKIAYLVAICVPLLVGRFGPAGRGGGNLIGGGAVAVLFAVSYLLFSYAYLSVWCFFAALLSLTLCYAFYKIASPALPPAGRDRVVLPGGANLEAARVSNQ